MLSFKSIFSVLCSPQLQEFQLKSVLFSLWSHIRNGFSSFLGMFHLASLPSCLGRIQERHLCCFLSSSFVKRRFSKREHLLHISTIEHRESRKLGVPRDISLGPRSTASWCLLACCPPHKRWEPTSQRLLLSPQHKEETFLEKGWLMTFSLLDFFSKSQGTTIR